MSDDFVSDVEESIKALMGAAFAGEQPEDVMRRKCRDMVAAARELKWPGPPFDPEMLASFLGIRVEHTDEDIGGEGRLLRLPNNRLLIQVNSAALEVRRRFTICHELAHTCFPNCFDRIRLHTNSPLTKEERRFERLCDVGASELLMPRDEFQSDLGQEQLSHEHIERISNLYVSSLDATGRRAVDFTSHPTCLAFLEPAVRGPRGKSILQVQYTYSNSQFPFRVSPKTKVPLKSVANSCYADAVCRRGVKEFWFADKSVRTLRVDAMRLPDFPDSKYAKVMAIINL